MKKLSSIFGVLLVIAAMGCATVGQADNYFATEKTVATVHNNSWNEVTVYIVSEGGYTQKLGEVGATETKTFPVGDMFVNKTDAFEVKILAGSRYRTYSTPVGQGSVIQLSIENNPNLSSIAVWKH